MPQILVPGATTSDLLDGSTPSGQPALLRAEPRHSFSVEYDPGIGAGAGNQIEWFIQDGVEPDIYPPGTSINGARIADGGLPEIARSADLEANSTSISDVQFKVADLGGEASLAIAQKWANRNSGRNALVRYYVHGDEEIDLDASLRHTFVLDAPFWYQGAVVFRCTDIQREAVEQNVLESASWRQITTLDDNGGKRGAPTGPSAVPTQAGEESGRYVILYGPDPSERLFRHSDAYAEQPGETVLYAESPEGEVYAIDEVSETRVDQYDAWLCRIAYRGAFRTTPVAVAVDASDEEGIAVDNLPEIKEVIYYAEPAASMLVGLLTRSLFDGRVLPAPHTHGLDAFAGTTSDPLQLLARQFRWLDVDSLIGADLDFPLVIRNPGKTKLLKFVETHILGAMGGVLLPDRHGRLTYRAIPKTTADAAYSGVLSAARGNLDEATIGPLDLQTSDRADPIIVKTGFDWRTDTYLDQPTYSRLEAIELVNGDTTPLELEFKSLGAGFQSDRQRHSIARRRAELAAYPALTTTVRSSLRLVDHDILDVIRVESDKVRNSYTGLPYHTTLGRSFVVTSSRKNYETSNVSYGVRGSTGEPDSVADSALETHLPDEWYERFPSLVDRLSRVGGSVGYANGELSGGDHLLAPGTYSHLGDLRIRSDFWATTGGVRGDRIMLVVRGELVIESPDPFRVKAMGKALGGAGATSSTAARPGGRGFVGGSSTGQPIIARVRYRFGPEQNSDERPYELNGQARVDLGRAITKHSGAHTGGLPELVLAVNNKALVGLPARLCGAGGHGAPAHRRTRNTRENQLIPKADRSPGRLVLTHIADGGNGAPGGMAIVYVSRTGGFAGSGGSDTSGGDAFRPGAGFGGPVGQPGWPGAGVWLIDGGQHKSLPDPSRFVCRVGAAAEAGPVVTEGETIDVSTSTGLPLGPLQGPESPLADTDLWRRMTYVAHVPPPARVAEEDRYTGAIDAFFDTQPDSRAELFVQDVRPGNADLTDAWITPAELESGRPKPTIEVLFRDTGWRVFNWSSDEHASFYASLISLAREYGTRQWFRTPTRPTVFNDGDAWTDETTGDTWILHTDRPDELVFSGEARVGDNRIRDPNFTGFADGESTWYVNTDTIRLPRFRPLAANTGGGGTVPGETGGSLPAPTNGYWERYSATAGIFYWTPSQGNVGTGLRYRIRQPGKNDVYRDGQTTNTHYLDNLGPDEFTVYVRLERPSDGEFSDELAIVRPAEAGGGGGGGGGTISATVTNVFFTAYSSTAGRIEWTPVQANEVEGIGWEYLVEPVGHNETPGGTIAGRASTGWELSGLSPGTTRDYRIRIQRGAETGPFVTASVTTP